MPPRGSSRWRYAGAGALALGLLALALWGWRSLVAPAHLVVTDLSVPQALREGGALIQARYCMRCHEMQQMRVGPGFAQIAQRYRKDAAAPDYLAGKIQHGSVGVWGRKLMPRQPDISPAQAQAMAAWVLAQPDPPAP